MIEPPRWSWIHWWEANRDRYLSSPSQLPPDQKADDEQLRALREQASGELIRMIETETYEPLLVHAALALGKMRHDPALAPLKNLAAATRSDNVRLAALVAIGMIGSPAAEADLVSLNPNSRADRVAGLAGVGLLTDLQPQTLNQLRALVMADEEPAVTTVVCWSLRQHPQQVDVQYYGNLLRTSASPWVASEALLALGRANVGLTEREVRRLYGNNVKIVSRFDMLQSVLHGTITSVGNVRALQELERYHQSKMQVVTKQMRAMHQAATRANQPQGGEQGAAVPPQLAEEINQQNPNVTANQPIRAATLDIGTEWIQIAWLRASAAIALGQFDDAKAGDALLRFVETPAAQQPRAQRVLRGFNIEIPPNPGEQYLLMPKSFAIMALASHPSERSRDRLIAILGKRDNRGRLQIDGPLDSPLRGFAALALGLYAAPYETPQGPADRANFEWAIQTLGERLDDPNEDPEVRSACAVALGLTQRTAVLPVLHAATEKLNVNNAREVAVFGYALLGRALAGDQSIHEIAEQFLLGTADDTSATGILSRRGAVLALGVLRTPTAVPVLTKAWHLNHYVNREVIVALRLAGANSAANTVLSRLRESNDRDERAYMAEALGELLAAEHPTPLNRLIADSNYTVRNDNLRPLQRMANEFLFDYLIPSLGEEW